MQEQRRALRRARVHARRREVARRGVRLARRRVLALRGARLHVLHLLLVLEHLLLMLLLERRDVGERVVRQADATVAWWAWCEAVCVRRGRGEGCRRGGAGGVE